MTRSVTSGSGEIDNWNFALFFFFHKGRLMQLYIHNYTISHFVKSPVMIEVGARLAGGRKAIMAEETVVGWHPFDAMVDAHCGFPVRMPPSFHPSKKAVQSFIASDKSGVLKSIKGDDFARFGTYHDHVMLKKVGDKVVRAKDIMSFTAYVWFIGDDDDVKRDAQKAREEFIVEVETNGCQ
mmetsp:Transcript_32577/g.68496  ORF Transcript_32577/g.68496 Transcript_32577/m.68496 type:complete len:181 (+) Transcript_32577:1344-1886(+)